MTTGDNELAQAVRQGARAAAYLELGDIRLFRSDCELITFPRPNGQLRWELDASHSHDFGGDDGQLNDDALVVMSGYDLALSQASDEMDAAEEIQIGRVQFTMGALYLCDDPPQDSFTLIEIEAFTQSVAAMAVYPYAREYVADVVRRMGLPMLTLNHFKLPLPKEWEPSPEVGQ